MAELEIGTANWYPKMSRVVPLYAALALPVLPATSDTERLNFIEENWFYKGTYDGSISFRFTESWDAGTHENLRIAIDTARAARIVGG